MACLPSQHFSAPSASGDPRILGPVFPKIWAGPIKELSKGFMRARRRFCFSGFAMRASNRLSCVCVCVREFVLCGRASERCLIGCFRFRLRLSVFTNRQSKAALRTNLVSNTSNKGMQRGSEDLSGAVSHLAAGGLF